METLKKIAALLLMLVIAGAAIFDTFIAFKVNDTFVPGLATLALVAAAVPAVVRVSRFLIGVEYDDHPFELGDEFETDRGERSKVVGFEKDGTPRCEAVD